MCDYSLAEASNRLATTGEHLITHLFLTGTVGLKSGRPRLLEILFPSKVAAVCIPPGAHLLLQDIPKRLQKQLGVTSSEAVTFIQRGLEANVHRDGVRFANGCEILLQQLEPGQRATVLYLGCEDEVSAAAGLAQPAGHLG
jgi:hypothetical protein